MLPQKFSAEFVMHVNTHTLTWKQSIHIKDDEWAPRIIYSFCCVKYPKRQTMLKKVAAILGETQEGYYQPLEKAELVREGGDVTILCYSRMRYVVMQAVQSLEKQGFDPEVFADAAACNMLRLS